MFSKREKNISNTMPCPYCKEQHHFVNNGKEITMNATPHGIVTFVANRQCTGGEHEFYTSIESVQKSQLEPRGYIFPDPKRPKYFLSSEYCKRITAVERDQLLYPRKQSLDPKAVIYDYNAPFQGIARFAHMDIHLVTKQCIRCTLFMKSSVCKARLDPEKLYAA